MKKVFEGSKTNEWKESYPKKKRQTIYSVIPKGQPYIINGGGVFIPVFDLTDHFHWVCKDCKCISRVIMVRRADVYAHTPTIYFYLHCPRCGDEGQRKIYLEDTDSKYLTFPIQTEPLDWGER